MKRSREHEEEEESPVESPEASSDETSSVASPKKTKFPAAKITELDESAVDASSFIAMKCSLPGHKEPLTFTSYGEYETHYNNAHTNRCHDCKKNFPSEHLLSVHIEEFHDAFAAVLREKGEHTYSCFVEGCDRKCRTPYKRRLHLIDKHMYPKNYFFGVTKDGIDGRNSLLLESGHHRRKSSISQSPGSKAASRRQSLRQPESPNTGNEEPEPPAEKNPKKTSAAVVLAEEKPDVEMAGLTSAMSSLQFIPTNVRFGRGRGKTGFSRT